MRALRCGSYGGRVIIFGNVQPTSKLNSQRAFPQNAWLARVTEVLPKNIELVETAVLAQCRCHYDKPKKGQHP